MSILIGHIGVDYDDSDPASYAGVSVYSWDGKNRESKRSFVSDSPTNDYWKAMVYLYYIKDVDTVTGSSSVDHFTMDGGVIDFKKGEDLEYLNGLKQELINE